MPVWAFGNDRGWRGALWGAVGVLLAAAPAHARSGCATPCPEGSRCVADGRCVYLSAAEQVEARAKQRAEGERRRAEAVRLRLEQRRRLRLQLGVRFAGVVFPDHERGGARTFGLEPVFRANYAKHLGLILGGELYAGAWDNRFVDRGTLLGMRVQLTPFVGPFARFYVGPTFVAGTASYTVQRSDQHRYAEGLTDELWVSGWGLRAGWLFGAREQIDVRMSWLSLIEADDFRISGFDAKEFQFGIGFAF